jgi:predicted HAD superfamily Cof-like phosphohydrolase
MPNSIDSVWNDVFQFNKLFKLPWSMTPVNMPNRERQLRSNLLHEEVNDFLYAVTVSDQAHELVDILFLVFGALVSIGVPPKEIFNAVLKANMRKLWPDGNPRFDEDWRIIKPEGWVSAADEIREIVENMQ